MAYTPNNWKDGDVITAEKMNKLEQAVNQASNNVLVIEPSGDGLNVTPNDIENAFENNSRIAMKYVVDNGNGQSYSKSLCELCFYGLEYNPNDGYLFSGQQVVNNNIEHIEFYAPSKNDYFVVPSDSDENPAV